MKKIITALIVAMGLTAQASLFTNIFLPGNWPLTNWWTNDPLPGFLVSSQAWHAVNENFRRASNAFIGIQTPWLQSIDGGGFDLLSAGNVVATNAFTITNVWAGESVSLSYEPVSKGLFINEDVTTEGVITAGPSNATARAFSTPATNLFEDLNFQVTGINPVGLPSAANLQINAGPNANMLCLDFAKSGTTVAAVNPQMQHNWVPGTRVYSHFHIRPKFTNDGTVVWNVFCDVGDINSVMTTNAVMRVTNTLAGGTNQHRHLLWSMPPGGISMTPYIGPSTVMQLRMERDGDDTADTYDEVISVIGFDVHILWGGSPVPYNP